MYLENEGRRQALNCVDHGQSWRKDTNPSIDAVDFSCRRDKQPKPQTPEAGLPETDQETRRLLHELQVHQIELESQNAQMRQAREEVETTLRKYSDLYDFAPVGYLTLARDGAIRAVNLTGANLLGRERSQLLSQRFGLFVADNASPAFTSHLGKVFGSFTKKTCEVALLKGGKNPVFVQIETVADASGLECRAVIIDISARRQLESDLATLHIELAARAAQLAEANIDLEAFNYTVSHDLCGPLTTISGYCQVLRELCSDQLNDQSKNYLGCMYEGTLRMKRLITSLLDFSRVTRAKIGREVCDLSAVAKAVAAEQTLAEPGRQVAFRIDEGISADGDAGLWRVVLDNLIGNAWKYTVKKDGAVIEFGMKDLEGKPVYFVRDNGPGFDMAQAEKLFVPFQRIPGIDVEGHGIGLATVERIVRRHGGRVWAESKPGAGATFLFTLA